MQSTVSLAPFGSKANLLVTQSLSVQLQVRLQLDTLVSNAHGQDDLQNITQEALQIPFAQFMTGLLGLRHPPSKKMSGKKNRLTARPKKIIIRTMIMIWKAQTIFGFFLHIPYIPSPAVAITVMLRPNAIPKTVYSVVEFPKKMLLLKKRQTVRPRIARPRTRIKRAPREVKHLIKGIIFVNLQSQILSKFNF